MHASALRITRQGACRTGDDGRVRRQVTDAPGGVGTMPTRLDCRPAMTMRRAPAAVSWPGGCARRPCASAKPAVVTCGRIQQLGRPPCRAASALGARASRPLRGVAGGDLALPGNDALGSACRRASERTRHCVWPLNRARIVTRRVHSVGSIRGASAARGCQSSLAPDPSVPYSGPGRAADGLLEHGAPTQS